jgi:hypothetical protein
MTAVCSVVIFAQTKETEGDKNNGYKYVDSEQIIKRKSSLISIIANPERYHKKEVYVTGFVCFDTEGVRAAVFNSTESAKHQILPDSLFVDYSDSSNKDEFIKKANGKWCLLFGVIDANKGGTPEMEYHACVLKISKATIFDK